MGFRGLAAALYEKIRAIVFSRVLRLNEKKIDSLLFWRIHVLFSILFAGVFIGFWALWVGVALMVEKQLWTLIYIDLGLWILGVILIGVPGISFRGRTVAVLAAVYGLGLTVILNVGVLSGGPVALFTFSVLVGVLMGAIPALVSVLINTATLSILCGLTIKGVWGQDYPFFDSSSAMVTSGVTFVLLNIMASVSVSALLTGISLSNEKEKQLTASLIQEKKNLLETQIRLEREIQEHRHTGDALGESERKYRRLFNEAPAGMYEIDFTRFRFVAVNDMLCRFSGYSRAEFLSLDPMLFLTDAGKDKFLDRYDKLRQGQAIPAKAEYDLRGKDGRILNVVLHNDYIFRNGKLSGARVVVHDLTERRKIEEMMIQSEKMMSVGGLAAGMAHEINNPLAGILQNAQLIENRLSLNLPANDQAAAALGTTMAVIRSFMEERGIFRQLSRIREAGTRAAGIVDNMLSFSRKNDGLKKRHTLSVIIEESIALASSDYNLNQKHDLKNIRIIREYEPDIPDVLCEKSKIQQVVFNIIKNGCQALAAAGQAPPQFTFRLMAEEGMVRMEIADNGPGIDPEIRSRVFEPFFTTKEVGNGTGLGLSVSYFIIVEDHGGEMTVDSVPGEGTRFIIKLPSYP